MILNINSIVEFHQFQDIFYFPFININEIKTAQDIRVNRS